MVSAAKMRRSTSAATSARPYAGAGWQLLVRLSEANGSALTHPLLAIRDVKKVLLVVITSHRGLAGGFNANVMKKVAAELVSPDRLTTPTGHPERKPAEAPRIDIATVGRKGEDALRRMGKTIVASFSILRDVPTAEDARPLAKFVMDQYANGSYDKVVIAYTDFVSALIQQAKFRQILPVSAVELEKMMAEEAPRTARPVEYLFEPSRADILDFLLPRMVETQIYQALLESSASEHSARMMAMRNASDAARDMIDDLTFTLNQARQAGITREISEIAAGKAALE